MADIKVIIKMPEEQYNNIIEHYNTFPAEWKKWGLEAIKDGVVLPKGHGRLIDADAFIDKCAICGWLDDISVAEFNAATPTIIKAE